MTRQAERQSCRCGRPRSAVYTDSCCMACARSDGSSHTKWCNRRQDPPQFHIQEYEIIAGQRIGDGARMVVIPSPFEVAVAYILWHHIPQEHPSFHGVFTSRISAQSAVPPEAGAGRIWGPPSGTAGGDVWVMDALTSRPPTYYIERVALNEFQQGGT